MALIPATRSLFFPTPFDKFMGEVVPDIALRLEITVMQQTIWMTQLSFLDIAFMIALLGMMFRLWRLLQIIWFMIDVAAKMLKLVQWIVRACCPCRQHVTHEEIIQEEPESIAQASTDPFVAPPIMSQQAFMKPTGEVMTQSQCTYTSVRGDTNPKYKPWNNYQGEVFRIR